jgi:hypothetical protein
MGPPTSIHTSIVLLDSLEDDREVFSFFKFCDIENLLNISKKLAKFRRFYTGEAKKKKKDTYAKFPQTFLSKKKNNKFVGKQNSTKLIHLTRIFSNFFNKTKL